MKNNAKKFPLPKGEQWARLPERVLALENTPSSGGGIEGSQYIFVAANGTDVENAAELQAAYDTTKTMSPSSTNRITVIAAPGNYNFDATPFTMDTQYIDLVSLDGNRSVIFNSANNNGTISITANDVFVKGVDVQTKCFTIGNNLNLLKIDNCKGGNNSFGGNNVYGSTGVASGTFINCEGGDFSFGASEASGTFKNCTALDQSFAWFGNCSGIFTDCTAGGSSFGAIGGTSSGTFTRCKSNYDSYGSVTGILNYCEGGNYGNISSGKLYFCRQNNTANSAITANVAAGAAIVAFIDKDNNFIDKYV